VFEFLKQGFTVLAQSRSEVKFDALKNALQKQGANIEKLHGVFGSFGSASEAEKVVEEVRKHGLPHHVISILGFVDPIPKPASETSPEDINKNWEESLWPNVRAANAFVPLLKVKYLQLLYFGTFC
jgi:hypothetical protein